ncbi:MAG: hypothetical protein ACJAVS_000453 [Paracoccaceae bacterium]
MLGFDLTSTTLTGLTVTTTADTVTFSYDISASGETDGSGVIIAGRFLRGVADVPLPAAAPLAGPGALFMVGCRHRA